MGVLNSIYKAFLLKVKKKKEKERTYLIETESDQASKPNIN